MFKAIRSSNWLTGAMIFLMPVMLIFFLGSQMAYSQVKGRFEAYEAIPEITRWSELEKIPAGQLVILRGQVSEANPSRDSDPVAPDLIIFQERPADGREIRFQEEFPLVFPEFIMDLPDGAVTIWPSLSRERIIQHELHTVPDGDRQRTGFRLGDTVTVQGRWQPARESRPALVDVTGISGADKAALVAEWQQAFQKVGWARNGLGLLTLIGLILLVGQLRRAKTNPKLEGDEEWQPPKTKTVPTA